MFKKYKSLKEFKSYFGKYRKILGIVIFVMLAASSLGMILPYLVSKRLIGITETSFGTIITYSIVIMTVILFHHIFWYFWEKIASVLNNSIAADIRKDIISTFADTEYFEIQNKTTGYYLERINDDVIEVSSFLSNILGICADCATNFSFVIIIYILNYQCGLIFTAGIAVLYIFEFIKIKINLKYTEILKELSERFNSKVNENYRGIKDIKVLGIKEQTVHNTDSISREIAAAQIKKDKILALLSRCKTFTQHLIETVLIVYAVGVLIPNNRISVIILLTIINYGGFMYDLVGYIAKIKDYFVRGDYKASRILQILDETNTETFGDCEKLDSYCVKIEDLSYTYGSNNDAVLKNITLEIPEKSAAVFTGSSGGGKTTLFCLLSRILKCDDDKIFIGNKDINTLSEKCLRDNLCIVNQEPFLLNNTVLNNIKIVRPSADLDEIYEACKKAHIYEEIINFENGLNTLIAENGSNLSGGQKQRISIARAVLKNSNILLFDEPTSSLDKQNHELFLQTINDLKAEKTVLLIAHKLGDYTNFDSVYELQHGQLYKQK